MPSTCISDLEIGAFLKRELDSHRLLQFADHVAECENCRKKLIQRKDLVRGKTSIEQDLEKLADHISEQDLQRYITGKLDLPGIRAVDGHLQRCPQCAQEVRDLRSFVTSLPNDGRPQIRRSPAGWGTGVVIVAVAIAMVTAFLWLRRGNELLVLNDSGNRVILDQHGKLKGVGSLNERQNELLQQALSQRKLTLPSTLHDLSGNTRTLMGKTESAAFRVVRPSGTFINTVRPTLSWTTDPETLGYKVTIHDESAGKNITSPLIQTTEWTVHEDLERGKTYVWQVVSLRKSGKELLVPAPPLPPARFAILNNETSIELQSLPKSHVARAILYANAGLLDDAVQELSTLKAENPESSVIQNFLKQIEQSR